MSLNLTESQLCPKKRPPAPAVVSVVVLLLLLAAALGVLVVNPIHSY